jgi:hypothetical protein
METKSKKTKSAAGRIAATAFKEFWLPLCAAIGLAIWGDDVRIKLSKRNSTLGRLASRVVVSRGK